MKEDKSNGGNGQKREENRRQREKKEMWFWRGYCVVLIFICTVCIRLLPEARHEIIWEQDTLYGSSAENNVLRAGMGYETELKISLRGKLEAVQKECDSLELKLKELKYEGETP